MTFRSSMKYRDNMGDSYKVKTKERGGFYGAGPMLGSPDPLLYGAGYPAYSGWAPTTGIYYPSTMYGGYYW